MTRSADAPGIANSKRGHTCLASSRLETRALDGNTYRINRQSDRFTNLDVGYGEGVSDAEGGRRVGG